MANRTSHRYNRLPLLPSDPGGVQQELVVPICQCKGRRSKFILQVGCLNQARQIEIKFHCINFLKSIRFEVSENPVVKFQITSLNLTILNRQFCSLKVNRVHLDKYFCSFQFFFEILMDDIFAQDHEVKPA